MRNVETGQERNVTTNSEGLYVAPYLSLGKHNVTAAINGFSTVVRKNVDVTLNQTVAARNTL